MNQLIEYAIAAIIGTAVMLISIAAQQNAQNSTYLSNNDQIAQQSVSSTAQILESDFSNIGEYLSDTTPAIMSGASSQVTFLSDINDDGTVDTLTYSTDDSTSIPSTPNIHDRHLLRQVNGGSQTKIGVVTAFDVRYMTSDGHVLTCPLDSAGIPQVYTVEITVEAQSPFGINRDTGTPGSQYMWYSSAVWYRTFLVHPRQKT